MRLARAILVCSLSLMISLALSPFAVSAQSPSPPQFLNARLDVAYVGDEVCRECHQPQYDSFKKTGMGRSLALPSPIKEGATLKPITLRAENLGRTYTVSIRNGKMFHSETILGPDGKPESTETHEVAYSVGSGDVGRSYIIAKGDALFVSPISYYSSVKRWGLSPGYDLGQFQGFTRPAWHLCLACHSGMPLPIADTRNLYQNPPFRFLSIGCERCHGPGEIHIKERKSNAPIRVPIDLSIVNPARLPGELRTDVCRQCHLSGEPRVLRPGKTHLDFRPGTPLSDTIFAFTVPVPAKPGEVKALGHPEQMVLSRCYRESEGRLACISCHDPHIQLSGLEAATYFRKKCLACHVPEECPAPVATRAATSPADNCVACHMPKLSVSNMSHSALTDHRIPRNPSDPNSYPSPGPPDELVLQTKPFANPEEKPDLRSLALAYYQASQPYPQFAKTGFALLKQAAREYPDDPEVQGAYGQVLAIARPEATSEAAQALQRALDLGSRSVEFQTNLARLRFKEGDSATAEKLYLAAISNDPYYSPAYFSLARLYLAASDRKTAAATLKKILDFDPGNDAAREAYADASKDPD